MTCNEAYKMPKEMEFSVPHCDYSLDGELEFWGNTERPCCGYEKIHSDNCELKQLICRMKEIGDKEV